MEMNHQELLSIIDELATACVKANIMEDIEKRAAELLHNK